MSEDFQEKSEEPTQKKLTDARKKGQVAKSQDLTASVVLLAGMFSMFVFGSFIYFRVEDFTRMIFTHLSEPYSETESIVAWGRAGLFYIVVSLLPLFGAVFIASLAINIVQVGFQIAPEGLKPKWSNLNLFNPKSYKKFFSAQAIVKLFMGFGKLGVIGLTIHYVVFGSMSEISKLMKVTPWHLFTFICTKAAFIGIVTGVMLFVLGVGDFIFQTWKFAKDMKMSRTEVKDERKQSEGDVQVKSRMRAMMQSFTQNRMKTNVPKADVVVANPIHYAIAIKYDPAKMPAPICVAKGARRLALSIRKLAEDSGVPVVENPPLARALYRSVEVGALIPPSYYHSIAEVLAYVYKIEEEQQHAARAKSITRPFI